MRDLKLRYRQTALGVVWVVAQPLLAAVIFAFVFGRVAGLSSGGVPYVIFAYAGLLGWNAFSETLSRSTTSLVAHQNMVSKVYFPRLLLPLSTVLSTLVNFAVSFVVFLALLVWGAQPLRPELLAVPLWLVLILSLATGVGLAAGALNVVYRDVGYVIPVAIQLLLYASPVAYALAEVPLGLRPYVALNPLTGLMDALRWSAFDTPLSPGYLVWSVVASLSALAGGALAFRSLERRFADVI